MKKIALLAYAVLLAACAGTPKEGCIIKGVIDDPDDRDGEYVFLVPAGPHEDADVDSVLIDKGHFEFVVDKEEMNIIRVTKYRRLGLQDLIVVTEPGVVEAVISSDSHAKGTPQNDSLQVWKDLTTGTVIKGESYKQRTREIAHNCGDDSTVGKFLLGMYPEPKEK